MDVIDNQINNPNAGMQLNSTAKAHIAETAKWANFLAIVGFVFLALFVIVAIFAGTLMSTLLASRSPMGAAPSFMLTITYLFIAVIYFFPLMYLYKFAQKAKSALRADDTHDLQIAFQNLKSVYKFMGILMIITLALYAIVFIIAIVGGGLAAMMG